MNSNSGGMNWQVAPHGILAFLVIAVALIIVLHILGFSVVGAVKVGS